MAKDSGMNWHGIEAEAAEYYLEAGVTGRGNTSLTTLLHRAIAHGVRLAANTEVVATGDASTPEELQAISRVIKQAITTHCENLARSIEAGKVDV